MSLIPVRHARRLASPAEAEAFFRGLRLLTSPSIGLIGLHTQDIKRIVRVIHALDTSESHTIHFKGGSLNAAARAALTRLVQLPFEFLAITIPGADLRVWHGYNAIVHSDRPFPKKYDPAEIKATPHGHDLETKKETVALDALFSVADERIKEGHINELKESTKPALLDFLRELQGTVHGSIGVSVANARALSELYAGERLDWRADGIHVTFPEGEIEGFMVSPNTTEDDRKKILKRLDKALARAGLGP